MMAKNRRRNRSPVPGVETTPHGVYVKPQSWDMAQQRADREGVTMSFVIMELAEGYVTGKLNIEEGPERSSEEAVSRSVRCSDQMWRLLQTRAEHEKRSTNSVLAAIVHGYGVGRLSLPTVIKRY